MADIKKEESELKKYEVFVILKPVRAKGRGEDYVRGYVRGEKIEMNGIEKTEFLYRKVAARLDSPEGKAAIAELEKHNKAQAGK